MARRNIYLPEVLDAEVQRWALPLSEICQEAIQKASDYRRTQTLPDEDVAATVSRLLADREAHERERYDEGFRLGHEWARDHAHWKELRRLEPRRGRPREHVTLGEDHSLHQFLLSWAFQKHDDAEPDWFSELDRGNPFERGVIDGATQVFLAVLPAMEGRTVEADE